MGLPRYVSFFITAALLKQIKPKAWISYVSDLSFQGIFMQIP